MADSKKQDEVLRVGELTENKNWQIVISSESAIISGKHLILNVLDEGGNILSYDKLTLQERKDAVNVLHVFVQTEATQLGRWVISLSGPYLIPEGEFHVHAICPTENDRVLRPVFNADDFYKRLESLLDFQNMLNLKAELQGLILELEDNLR